METSVGEASTALQTLPLADRWSLKRLLWAASPLALALGIIVISVVSGDIASAAIAFITCVLSMLVTIFSVSRSIIDLMRGRPRLAASSIAGVGIPILGVFATIHTGHVKSENKTYAHLADFEQVVAEQRMRTKGQSPVRMGVFEQDHSQYVGSNSFEQVIYDETDEIDHNPDGLQGYWIYPNSPTGVIDVGYGRKFVKRIDGHFYQVWIADP